MNNTSSTIEDRLARYRPALEAAIGSRADQSEFSRDPHDLIQVDPDPADDHRRRWSRSLVGTSIVVVIGVVAALVYLSGASPDTSSPSASSDAATTSSIAGATTTRTCPEGTETATASTLYLGQPGSDRNLAADGFIFSLPSGTKPAEVALKAVSSAVIGLDCGITAVPSTTSGDPVTVLIDPPAVPTQLRMMVVVSARNRAVGVTGIHTLKTTFDIDTSAQVPVLTMTLNHAPSAVRAQVRFKKGDDVWELSASATDGTQVPLAVPSGKKDRYPAKPVEWVLFTLLDANDRVVGVGGAMT
jgi:hypothetical protein